MRPEGLWVRIRFRSNEAATAVLADIGDGTLRGLSIGYSVEKWAETRDGERRIRTAKRWTPIEISIVPIPADPGAHFRHGETTMEAQATTIERPGDDTARSTRAAVNAEIRGIGETAGLTRAWADAQIGAEVSADEARSAAFEAMRQRGAETRTRSTGAEITFDHDAPEVVAQRAGEALYARMTPQPQMSAAARPFAGFTLLDHARGSLQRAGIRTTALSPEEVFRRAGVGYHTTADFPAILGDTIGRDLRGATPTSPPPSCSLPGKPRPRIFACESASASPPDPVC